MLRVSLKGLGSRVPERVVPNSYFEQLIETTDEWIASRSGIRERRFIEPEQGLIDLAGPAAEKALEMAGVDPREVGLIIVGSATADYPTPATACLVQERLGNKIAGAMDLNAACPGFLYSLAVGQRFVADGTYKYVLVIGGEVTSGIIDFEDRATCVLFGDGAGAVVLGPAEEGEGEILSTHLRSDGELGDLLIIPAGGSKHPINHELIDQRLHYVKMQGNDVFKHAVRMMVSVAEEALEKNGLTAADVDWLVPHQANLRIMTVVAKRLGIPREKVIVTVHKYGNTSAGTIPVALDEAFREGRIKRGDLVLMNSFGAGFTWASALIRM